MRVLRILPFLLAFCTCLNDQVFQQLIKPESDEDLNLDHKIEKIGRHQIYGQLQRCRRSSRDMIVLFYHPMCPHCREFIPRMTKVVNSVFA